MAIATAYSSVNMETAYIWDGSVTVANSNLIQISSSLGTYIQNYFGSFSYGYNHDLSGGTVNSTNYYAFGSKVFEITGGVYSALTIKDYIDQGGSTNNLFNYVFAGDDTLTGSLADDVLDGYAGNDRLNGSTGNDILNGGAGNDTYLFGIGSGNDEISESEYIDRTYYFGNYYDSISGAGGNDQVLFPNINKANVSFTKANNGNDLVITLNATGETLTIVNNFSTDTSWAVESFVFADGPYQLPVNSAPKGLATAHLSSSEDASYVITALDLLQGFTDVDNDTLSVINLTTNTGYLSSTGYGSWSFIPAANYHGIVSLSYTISDGNGGLLAANQSLTLSPVNDAPTGSVGISGTTMQGDRLTAYNNLADADGLGLIHYQWQANGINLSGATADSYTLTQNDVGKTLSVIATYTDADGTTETVKSASTNRVAPPNLVINGTVNNDNLSGNAGNDTLNGGDGDDGLNGGAGDDVLNGGNGNDWGQYWNAPIGVTVNLNLVGFQNTLGAGVDRLISIENLNGSNFADFLTGDAFNNQLIGGNGDDTLVGGDGGDGLLGGAGNDLLKGGNGSDWAQYWNASAGVSVNLALTGGQNTLGAGVDSLSDIENINGSLFNDSLIGNALANQLLGGGGNDTLSGGAGNDTLTGGIGNDVFKLLDLSKETIKDFSVPDDTIYLENAIFTRLAATGVLNAAQFVTAAVALDGNDYLIYNKNSGVVFYDDDGNGSHAALPILIIGSGLSLANTDFVVI